MVLRCSDQINKLTHLGLVCDFVEQLEQVDVVRFLAEMRFDEMVYGSFEHEGVVDGDVLNTWYTVPARLITTSDRLIHHIIGNKEERLELQTTH